MHAPSDAALDPMTRIPTNGLGIVPHQIRGILSHFQNIIITGQNYDKCTACSTIVSYSKIYIEIKVKDEYLKRGYEFLQEAFQDPKVLEILTGLDKLNEAVEDDGFEWSDSE